MDLQLGGLFLKSKTLRKDHYDQHTGCGGGLKEKREEVSRQLAAALLQFKVAETSQILFSPTCAVQGYKHISVFLPIPYSQVSFLICESDAYLWN